MTYAGRIVALALLGSLLTGIGFIALLPPFEGFDETAHYSYIQQIAETGRWPRRGDKISAEIDRYMASAPTAELMSPRWTYFRFFNEGGDRAAAADALWRQAGPTTFEPGEIANWQAQHPPLYYALLAPLCSRVDVWRTIYMHPLQGGADAVVEWIKGSALRPFLAALSQDERPAFLGRSRDAIAQAYLALDDGTVLLPYPRLFIVATRK